MFKKILNNQSGFSLAEVLVAAGISSVVALSTMQIGSNAQKAMRKATVDAELNTFFNFTLRGRLSRTDQCINILGASANGLAENTGVDSQTINLGSGIILSPSGDFPQFESEFTINDVLFRRESGTSCQLEIVFSRKNTENKVGFVNRSKFVNLSCGFDTSNVLVYCSTTDDMGGSNSTWTHELAAGDPSVDEYAYFDKGGYPAAVLGSSQPPAARFTVSDSNNQQFVGAPYTDSVALPSNGVIRWATDPFAFNQGVSIVGDQGANCIKLLSNAAGIEYLSSCLGQTDITGNLVVAGDISGANINATTAISSPEGTITNINSSEISNTGTVQTSILQVDGNANIAGNMGVDGIAVFNNNVNMHGSDVDITSPTVNINGGQMNVGSETNLIGPAMASVLTVDTLNVNSTTDLDGTIVMGDSFDGTGVLINSQLGATAKNFYSWSNPTHPRHVIHRGWLTCTGAQIGLINSGGFTCVDPPTCPAGRAMNGINSDGSATCL